MAGLRARGGAAGTPRRARRGPACRRRRLRVTDTAVRFTPSFPFDPGARYRVAVDTGTLPGGSPGVTTAIVGRPAQVVTAPQATVTSVSPGGDVIPENVLRLYLHFSAPMGRRGGGGHVRLLDEDGREVVDPFLPLEAELWNGDHTRYTLFLDPGRVKTGIRPNDEMGRALVGGRRYTLVVDPDWRDAPWTAPVGASSAMSFAQGRRSRRHSIRCGGRWLRRALARAIPSLCPSRTRSIRDCSRAPWQWRVRPVWPWRARRVPTRGETQWRLRPGRAVAGGPLSPCRPWHSGRPLGQPHRPRV